MTIAKTRTVARRFIKLGRFCRQKASRRALTLSCLVASKWNRAITAPSNSVPLPTKIKKQITTTYHLSFHSQNVSIVKENQYTDSLFGADELTIVNLDLVMGTYEYQPKLLLVHNRVKVFTKDRWQTFFVCCGWQ